MAGGEVARGRGSLLAVAGAASIGAGAIHATAAGMHAEHRQALWAFVLLTAFQVGWGAIALRRSTRGPGWLAGVIDVVGAVGNAVAVGGWVLATTSGIGFVDGLEGTEDVHVAGGIAAALAAVAVAATLADRLGLVPARTLALDTRLLAGAAALTLVAAVPGMVSAADHGHAAGAHDPAAGAAHGDDAHTAPVATKPFDPDLPIDLGGVEGITPEQQARAENLLAVNLLRLPQWADPAVAEAAGYHSIGDAATGDQHLVNWSLVDDDRILDPDHPESLVYAVDGGGNRTLEAAMYMLPRGTDLDEVPDIGGDLTQWHVHQDLCLTDDPVSPQVRGVISANEDCRPPLVKIPDMPMIHVWIVPNRCGPFASLEGVGAGQVLDGGVRLCDAAHGGHGS